jgi:putative component of membrane protein insertase Oxa1/YidC/SpoIIIJ protein YidD
MLRSPSRYLLVFSSLIICLSSIGQQPGFKSDIKHINLILAQVQTDPFSRPYIYKNEPSVLKKINPVSLLLGGTLYIYQNVLSKHISADCLFIPSCSEFCKQTIREDGIIKGTLLSIDRVNRCNRIAATDLKRYSADQKTKRYPDPVSRYRKTSTGNGEK